MSAPGGESAHQQNLAVSALGVEYVAAPYETRRKDLAPEDVEYRFVGVVDGTELSYDPPLAGAPTDAGEGPGRRLLDQAGVPRAGAGPGPPLRAGAADGHRQLSRAARAPVRPRRASASRSATRSS
jgi:hypothetical protein